MPLQNRVMPDGTIVSHPARAMLMGNRGGRLHDPETRTLSKRRWASRRWIACKTAFKSRHRTVMGNGYTEQFFLDEVTALAAGHRPCFECRRQDAERFAAHWVECFSRPGGSMADHMDRVLHNERTGTGEPKSVPLEAAIAQAVVFEHENEFYTTCDGRALKWSFEGYQPAEFDAGARVTVLTSPSIVRILKAGYQPLWHQSVHRV